LMDLSGRNVLSTEAQSETTVFSVDGFASGVYIVEIINESIGLRERKQLVIE